MSARTVLGRLALLLGGTLVGMLLAFIIFVYKYGRRSTIRVGEHRQTGRQAVR